MDKYSSQNLPNIVKSTLAADRCFDSPVFMTPPRGDISMKVNGNTQIPNLAVYSALYAIIFGISIWLLIAHKESPTNWFLYTAMLGSVLAGLIKFAVHSRKQ
jgi:hypothetical protein